MPNGYTAEYNLHDNRLKLFIKGGDRMSKPDFDAAKKLMGQYYPGSGCLTGTWTPAREDFILQHVEEIDFVIDDDCGLSYRVDRFSGYAGTASRNSASARARADAIADNIPLGQPILVGHHSERHARKDAERIHNGMTKCINESARAAYWKYRAEAAERHAAYKERPDVIRRRIEKYEAELRLHQRRQAGMAEYISDLHFWGKTPDGVLFREKYDTTTDFMKAEQEAIKHGYEAHRAHEQRWLDHLQMLITYQNELYQKAGFLPVDKDELHPEVGGAIKTADGWLPIMRVNPKSITVLDTWREADSSAFERQIKLADIKAVLLVSKAEYDAAPPEKTVRAEQLKVTYTEKYHNKKDGSLARGMGIRHKPHYRDTWSKWYEIQRVNPKSLTVVSRGLWGSRKYADVTQINITGDPIETMTPEEWAKHKEEHYPDWPAPSK